MTAMDTATILDSLASRIEALVPAVQFSDDDRFRVTIGTQLAVTGPRQVLLSAQSGTRKPTGGQTCSDWETTAELVVVYADSPPEQGQRGVYSRAIQDAEDILNDLYTGATTTTGVLAIEPDPGSITPDGQGLLESARSIFIRFERS